jgi:hypothetical protein
MQHVQIGSADAAGERAHERLPWTWGQVCDVIKDQTGPAFHDCPHGCTSLPLTKVGL